MDLYLEPGAKLLGSSDTDDYPLMKYRFEGLETLCYASLLNTRDGESGEPYRNMNNGDGFDPDSCTGVAVLGCTIASEDDCIAIKSGRDEEGRSVGLPTEDVLVSDCSFLSGFGVCTSRIHDVAFVDLDLQTLGGNAVFLAGLPESPLEKLSFVNVRARGLYGLKAYNVRDLCLEDCVFLGVSGPALTLHDVLVTQGSVG